MEHSPVAQAVAQLLPMALIARAVALDERATPAQGRVFGPVGAAYAGPVRQYRDGLGLCIVRLARSQGQDLDAVLHGAGAGLATRSRSPILRRRSLKPGNPRTSMSRDIKKVVLAYSGGLDTSVILKWLQETYGCEVVTFTADLGQGEELEPARKKAQMLGIKEIFVEDLREEFVRDFVFPMFRANALYEGLYLLGTSIARPLIAKRQIEIAAQDRRRRRRPWRHRQGQRPGALRADLLCAESRHQGDRALARMGPDLAHQADRLRREAPDPHRQGQARRGAVLDRREPAAHPPARARRWRIPGTSRRSSSIQRTISPEQAPDKPTYVEIEFERGDAVAIDGKQLSPAALLTRLNELGKAQRHRPARPGGEPLRRHEEPRRL